MNSARVRSHRIMTEWIVAHITVLVVVPTDTTTHISTFPPAPTPGAFVNVGWGKKETQFHGSAGKQAAVSVPCARASLSVAAADDRKPRISWRGDGAYYACSTIHETEGTECDEIAWRGWLRLAPADRPTDYV